MPTPIRIISLISAICVQIQGSRLVYHNEASQPNELDMMELFIGEPPQLSRQTSNILKRSDLTLEKDKQAAGGLWFGPRLGRRRRRDVSVFSDGDPTRSRRSVDGPLDAPWALMTFAGGKREGKLNYSPRLGRTLEEEDVFSYIEPALYDTMLRAAAAGSAGGGGARERDSNNNNFSPRLGRLAPLPQPNH